MRFSINRIQQNNMDLVVLKDEKTGTSAEILPEVGAALHTFSLGNEEEPFNVIDNYNGLVQAKKEMGLSYKSAKLSPFVCRIPEGKYVYDGKEWEFDNKFMDGSAIHGLIYNKNFVVTHETADDNKASVSMQYDYKMDDSAYPYHYKCRVDYELSDDNVLQLRTTITNESAKAIPIADGWHPYFQLGGIVDDWTLFFDAKSIVEFDDKLIPSGNFLEYHLFKTPEKIGDRFFDNCFLVNTGNEQPACVLFNPENKLKLSFFPDKSYPYLQVYTPPHRKSIAIENLSGAPDTFNNKMGLIVLAPWHSQSFTVRYQLSWV